MQKAPSPVRLAKPKSSGEKNFSISEAIKFGFNFLKANLVVFLKLALALIVINIAMGIMSSIFSRSLLGGLWGILSIIISIMVQIGFTKIIIDLHDGKPLNYSHFYSLYRLTLRFIGASILYGLIVMVGFILLIIPGIIWAIKFQFYSFLIVDKGVGVMDSLKQSSAMTEGVKVDLFLFGLLLVVINIIGAVALGIGLFVTIPTTIMATVFVYRKLLSQTPGI
ncbi:MAG: hypothetical protein M1372_01930 [Patescibacteria group bacterium]|nr:hypothetical protein [Patescibacteria group bacterium]